MIEADFVNHKNYIGRDNGFADDISLLTLKTAIGFNKKIQPACLWKSKDASKLAGRTVMASGYGKLGYYSGGSSTMRDITSLKILDNSERVCKIFKVRSNCSTTTADN